MFRLDNGNLTMDNIDLAHIKALIDEEGYTAKEALKIELELSGIDIKKVLSIELKGNQMTNKDYIDIYSEIVCDFWNNG